MEVDDAVELSASDSCRLYIPASDDESDEYYESTVRRKLVSIATRAEIHAHVFGFGSWVYYKSPREIKFENCYELSGYFGT